MPNIDNNTILIIAGAVVILFALLMMKASVRKFVFTAGGLFSAEAEAGTPGARVLNTKIRGNVNEVSARGDNALAKNTDIEGHGNKVSPNSGDGA